jgi:hypothetical protein
MQRTVNYCRAGGWLLLSAGFGLLASSCDGSADVSQLTRSERPAPSPSVAAGESGCVPGQASTCLGVCAGFGLGYQVCANDGGSYGPCICPEVAPIASVGVDAGSGATVIPPRRAPGEPGGGLPVDFPGAAPVAAIIGATCARDGDCGGALNCFSAGVDSLGVGGPSAGYCSMGCDTAAACTAVDRGATCGTLGGRRLCLRGCRSQAPEAGTDKCLGRADLTCLSSAAVGDEEPTTEPQFGVCVPSCPSDAACAGRRCDLSTGLCTDSPRTGDPIGAACDEPEGCAAGICLGATDASVGFCSAFCTVGVDGCGFDGSESSIGAACLFPQIPGEGQGDRGLCFELCDVAEDCTEPGFECAPQATRGRAGVCVPPPPEPPGSPEVPSSESLGLPCEADEACGDDLVCLGSDGDAFGVGGGPAEGYCSAPCAFAEDCPAGAVCATTPGGGYCLKACDTSVDDACARETAVCVPLGAVGACLPDCSSDDQCGDRLCDLDLGLCVEAPSSQPVGCTEDADCAVGICDTTLGLCVLEPDPECTVDADCATGVCDLDLGVCVSEPDPETGSCTSDADCADGVCDVLTGACSAAPEICLADEDCDEGVCDVQGDTCIDAPPVAIGAACSEDAECTGPSAGDDDSRLCLGLGGSNFCSAICVWGTARGCEAYGTDAFCVFPIDDVLGACLELCNVADECAQSGYDCVDIGTTVNGRAGACLPPPSAAPAP